MKLFRTVSLLRLGPIDSFSSVFRRDDNGTLACRMTRFFAALRRLIEVDISEGEFAESGHTFCGAQLATSAWLEADALFSSENDFELSKPFRFKFKSSLRNIAICFFRQKSTATTVMPIAITKPATIPATVLVSSTELARMDLSSAENTCVVSAAALKLVVVAGSVVVLILLIEFK